MEIAFDGYYSYSQLVDRLHWLADQHAGIMRVECLGRSHEGREVPVVILTNAATGPDQEKPAFWVDGNIHATELTASMAALGFVKKLVDGYGTDPKATRVLDETAVYVVPRLNPDGAELALADRPRFIRSGTRPYPFPDRRDGLHPEDIDGDGRVLQMRVPDPAGDWRISPRDSRLMLKRQPDEEDGTYYRLFAEGRVENYDGHLVAPAPPLEGLDFNRNFPGAWRPEGEQRGAGDFPGSEPEIRAVVEFLARHPNVFGALTFHTSSRAILRPYGTKADDQMETDDLWVFEAIGARGTQLTGYPCVSVFHHFRYHPKEVITGVFDDWLYDHKGVFAYTVELWDLPTAAGIEAKNRDRRFVEWFRQHPPEDDECIVAFADTHAPGGLVDWYPFDHPQLGRVELGGWNTLFTWDNPPPGLLEAEIAPQAEFALAFAALAPRLRWREVQLTRVADDAWQLLAVVENTGFLPTHVSSQARKMKAVQPVRVELELPAGGALIAGKRKQEVGHLEGRSNKLSVTAVGSSPTDNRGRAEWVIRAPRGGFVRLCATAERAGTIRRDLALG